MSDRERQRKTVRKGGRERERIGGREWGMVLGRDGASERVRGGRVCVHRPGE